MEKLGKTKRQHYVPQMILRNFSNDSATTSLLVLGTEKRVPAAPINRQCYEPYFYGADQAMEQLFAVEENKVAGYLGDLSRAKLEGLSESDIEQLKLFVHYQHARTRGAAEHLSRFAEALAKGTLRSSAKVYPDPDFRAEDVDKVEIRLQHAQIKSIWMAAKTSPLVRDMAVKLILTDRTPGFLIADHPVVAYNQFAEHHPVFRHCLASTGLALKGLQLFMPLSPSVTLALYDPATYQYGGKSRFCTAGPQDVRLLNEMQTVSAWECVFFREDRATEESIDGLFRVRRAHPSLYKKSAVERSVPAHPDGKPRHLVWVNHPEIKLGAKLSFVRSLDGHGYDGYDGITVPERDPGLVDLTRAYGQMMEEEWERTHPSADSASSS